MLSLGLVAVLNQAQYQGLRHHIKEGKRHVAPYLGFPDRPKTPNQHQTTLPGTGDPKTNKLQPLRVCSKREDRSEFLVAGFPGKRRTAAS